MSEGYKIGLTENRLRAWASKVRNGRYRQLGLEAADRIRQLQNQRDQLLSAVELAVSLLRDQGMRHGLAEELSEVASRCRKEPL